MSVQAIASLMEEAGGECWTPPTALAERLSHVRAYLFDWDGVFNDGTKGPGAYSLFTEADSMGTNLLRFGHWLAHGRQLPLIGIITGQHNPAAFALAERERFPVVYYGFKDKTTALQHFCADHQLTPQQVAFTFDDVLDLSVAEQVGTRFLIRRSASPLMAAWARQNKLADYHTAHTGGFHAVREVCELILGLQGRYGQAVAARMAFGEAYTTYLAQRNEHPPRYYTPADGQIVEQRPNR